MSTPVKSKSLRDERNVDFRLKEWALNIGMPVSFGSGESIQYRIMNEHEAACIRGTAIKSDGGLYAALCKYEYELQTHAQAREVNRMIMQMPYDYASAVTVTYCTKPGKKIGRPTAADKMGIPERNYVELFNRAIGWLQCRLCG